MTIELIIAENPSVASDIARDRIYDHARKR